LINQKPYALDQANNQEINLRTKSYLHKSKCNLFPPIFLKMTEDITRVNTKDVVTRIAGDLLRYMRNRTTHEYGRYVIQWAKEYGATITPEQEASALERLKNTIPEPAQWPSLEVVSNTAQIVKTTKNKPAGTRTASGAKKSTDYRELVVPEGREAPKCNVLLASGGNKGNACGKVCCRVLDEHDMTDDECINMRCNHVFCGQHVSKAGNNDEVKALDRLQKEEAPIVSNGKVVDTKIASEVSEAKAANAGNSAMAKILSKLGGKKSASPPPTATE
jgi:hypothetical protein